MLLNKLNVREQWEITFYPFRFYCSQVKILHKLGAVWIFKSPYLSQKLNPNLPFVTHISWRNIDKNLMIIITKFTIIDRNANCNKTHLFGNFFFIIQFSPSLRSWFIPTYFLKTQVHDPIFAHKMRLIARPKHFKILKHPPQKTHIITRY